MSVVVCGKLSGFVNAERLTIEEGGVFEGDAFVREANVNGGMVLNSGTIANAKPSFNTCIAFVLQNLLFSFPDYSYAWLFVCGRVYCVWTNVQYKWKGFI